jgi:hypothetical protein
MRVDPSEGFGDPEKVSLAAAVIRKKVWQRDRDLGPP